GAGVIMREGMNVRGLNTAATLWCSAGIGVLCGLGQFKNALAATIIILCANILLREAAQRINQLPVSAEGEKRYILKVTCNKEDESEVRQWLLNIVKEAAICLQGLGSVPAQEQGYKEIRAELVGHADYRKTRELIISRIGDNDNITAIHWSIDSQ
ncbi:MgtC family protein, partial [Salmonella enterica]|nr:MgtC family protein [Salmonella enterica]